MSFDWKKAFSQCGIPWDTHNTFAAPINLTSLIELKEFLDIVHTKFCLLKPFCENEDYPIVDNRELLPSFESDMWEYKNLPGFSLVAFDRQINYFSEIFQFDILHSLMDETATAEGKSCPLEQTVISQNVQAMQNRMPKKIQDTFKQRFMKYDVSVLDHYPQLLPFILEMDRAQVMALDSFGNYYLSGIYASFPSELDAEIKRFGMRAGKFSIGDNEKYERNRLFVYQYLMELYGFPIVSERRTSSALFARRLHKMGERFLIRVLGQSDRTLTTLYTPPKRKHYPLVEKIALVKVHDDQTEVIRRLEEGGFFVDEKKRIVILRVTYAQHKFNPDNVRQERALSVMMQEVIHPLTGRVIDDLNIIKDTTNMFLRLNDIVRGEHMGRITYKRNEIVENTDTDEKRLKFLYAWLSKHQRRIIGYSDEFFGNVVKVLDGYLLSPDNYEAFGNLNELYQEVWTRYSFIQQARKIKVLEDLRTREFKGERISYGTMLTEAATLLHGLKFEIVSYFDELVASVISIAESILNDRYLTRNYIEKRDDQLTPYGMEMKKQYRKLVSLLDEFKAIRKSRREFSQNR
ncbi:hypothetical protein LN040_02710 [Desulfovibrio subterraneus]|uniref:Uncharacterized protein n=1 Tax=Desulfovibrio subterraneus TaxID=2718620 RepID=A0A7J0BL22_9BACT|nr:hypothetical protein [Desulfovibrio subterraneus]WBF69276.1 hypothetical protein LN040_02710 [Desulfovibrio subterraneus]GFM33912.1 hypothetical protein DSM101010T_22770 [Desulfovibrio subterraneus]